MTYTSTDRPTSRASGTLVPVIKDLPQLLGTETGNATWVITSTLLSCAVATPITGRLGDLYGKRRMLILSLMAYPPGFRHERDGCSPPCSPRPTLKATSTGSSAWMPPSSAPTRLPPGPAGTRPRPANLPTTRRGAHVAG